MSTYAVTGAASGMGRAVADQLRAEGHRVIGVDVAAGDTIDVVADLGSASARADAAQAVLELCGGTLDGAVTAAGLGPVPGRERIIAEVNARGTIELLTAWRPALAASGNAKVVVFGSNSTTTTPLVSRRAARALLNGDVEGGVRRLTRIKQGADAFTYAASKSAVTWWARESSVTDEWAGQGIRLNVIAPGAVMTPMLESQLDGPEGKRVKQFPIPIGGFGDPEQIAAWVVFMLSPAADFLVGSVITVDGGSEAVFRADDWPTPVGVTGLKTYLRRLKTGIR